MKKITKKWFTGNGPFSSINEFTTEIGMIQGMRNLGIQFEEDDFSYGVLNYERIISDGDKLKKDNIK